MRCSAWTTLYCGLTGLCLMSAGCGGGNEPETPELIPVSGTVTLNGAPLPEAAVMFLPETTGQPSAGRTDQQGQYTLTYSNGDPGAVAGKHRVEIRTGGEYTDKEGNLHESKELLPPMYHSKSALTADISATAAPVNFDLKAKK